MRSILSIFFLRSLALFTLYIVNLVNRKKNHDDKNPQLYPHTHYFYLS